MMTLAVTIDELDALLAPYYARAVTLSREEIVERRRGIAFGAELSRLQGGHSNAAAQRVRELYCLGQIERYEVLPLLKALAQAGLHERDRVELGG